MNENKDIPFVAFESVKATMERTIRRLWILAIILVLLLFGSNAAWIAYESQFTDEVTETYTSEADGGGLAIVNRDGSVIYGEGDLHEENDKDP